MRVAALIALALLLRVLVPAGLMPRIDAGGLRLVVCTGEAAHAQVTVPLGQPDHEKAPGPGDLHKAAPCAFAGLGAPVLGGASPILLAVAMLAAFAAALWRRPTPTPRAPAALRPPLRGPPVRG
ncbi:MAG: hypothetical protein A4S12_00080 [Proteobacteria bacterium SG_bin5]|nr:MAG: hypothetical protein A4S12_00080 [Proteobacteria bacterium SG_bin5]